MWSLSDCLGWSTSSGIAQSVIEDTGLLGQDEDEEADEVVEASPFEEHAHGTVEELIQAAQSLGDEEFIVQATIPYSSQWISLLFHCQKFLLLHLN